MGTAAINKSYLNANEIGLRQWVATFGPGTLSIALTDTFGTEQFLKDFTKKCPLTTPERTYAEMFQGVRQDSGDPAEFAKMMRKFYDEQGITERKTIVFSDSLDVDKCIQLRDLVESEGFNTSFGVGTHLTNDFVHAVGGGKSTPLNIVIKISSADGTPAVKLSDNMGKNTGDKDEVRRAKEQLGYVEKNWEEGDETKRWGREGENPTN